MKPNKDISELADKITTISQNANSYLLQEDFEQARQCFEEAFEISKQIRDPFTERKCAFNLGAVYIRLGKAGKGIEYLELSIPPTSVQDDSNCGDLYFNVGIGYEMQGQFDIAVDNFKKALKEYRNIDGNSNSVMVKETLEKLAKNSQRLKCYFEASEYCEELCQLYNACGNEEKKLIFRGEQIVNLRKANEREKCVHLAEDMTAKVDNIIVTPLTANMLNDVGLVLSQYEKFDGAEICYKRALSMVSALKTCDKLEAVLLQNLGALANITRSYKQSIDYHSRAAEKFSSFNNPMNEGHCYANLGYAYNQIGDVDKSREYFCMALRKAKDNGDSHAEWQVLESLGALSRNLGNLDLAVKYYTDAFKAVTNDKSNDTASSEDRIQSKLFHIMKENAEKQQKINNQNQLIIQRQNVPINHTSPPQEQQQQIFQQKDGNQSKPQVQTPVEETDRHPKEEVTAQHIKTEAFFVNKQPENTKNATTVVGVTEETISKSTAKPITRKELIQRRRLKVRRSGSQGEFDKVARGVYVSTIAAGDMLDKVSEDAMTTDAESTLSSASNTDSDTSPERGERNIVREEMKKILIGGYKIKDKFKQYVTGNEDKKEESMSESETDSEVSSLSNDSSQDEENKAKVRPSIPIESPPQTLVKTYEKPVEVKPHYEEIEFGSINKSADTEGEKRESYHADVDLNTRSKVMQGGNIEENTYAEIKHLEQDQYSDYGPNYFYDDRIQQAINDNEGLQSTSLSETMYATIQDKSEQLSETPNSSASRLGGAPMSRAERERFLFEQHMKTQQPEPKQEEEVQKTSKICVIM